MNPLTEFQKNINSATSDRTGSCDHSENYLTAAKP